MFAPPVVLTRKRHSDGTRNNNCTVTAVLGPSNATFLRASDLFMMTIRKELSSKILSVRRSIPLEGWRPRVGTSGHMFWQPLRMLTPRCGQFTRRQGFEAYGGREKRLQLQMELSQSWGCSRARCGSWETRIWRRNQWEERIRQKIARNSAEYSKFNVSLLMKLSARPSFIVGENEHEDISWENESAILGLQFSDLEHRVGAWRGWEISCVFLEKSHSTEFEMVTSRVLLWCCDWCLR